MFKDHHDRSDPTAVAYPTATLPECQAVQQVLLDEMDWAGTTEMLSQETLLLLAYMLSSGTAAPVNLQESIYTGAALNEAERSSSSYVQKKQADDLMSKSTLT
jgi:hypothetical protein